MVDVATGPPPKNCIAAAGGRAHRARKSKKRWESRPRGCESATEIGGRVPYWMTVGVPVTVQPGNVTELYPDRDGSP